ncbi:helix-turn-helix transcriptional regulator [Clostridium perfringens]|uniref:helix-turn-helix transcriptional regulator n=1 Tax=Clostridium perfringens TaxID=1502 RepID=UPI0018E413E3|nr:helix-turn-helix transcriptional regulator [Clostridium perfringens]MBI5995891.1 helix-turn-helix transcriptional regulator [Clostridium perfringens]MDU4222156.1 helix-turn-helix transcriptional regulator [Clostridium perfringens]HAT4114580.1 helix-turn-helix transcriptional regulator [Clostridium perfringens]
MNIKLLRIKKGLTQEELSKDLGIARQTLIKVEKGDFSALNYEKILRIMTFFNKSFEELFLSEN